MRPRTELRLLVEEQSEQLDELRQVRLARRLEGDHPSGGL
jgi:hypothetical protein